MKKLTLHLAVICLSIYKTFYDLLYRFFKTSSGLKKIVTCLPLMIDALRYKILHATKRALQLNLFLCLLFCLIHTSISAQVTLTTNPTNAQINTALSGTGVTITGGTLSGGASAVNLRANQVAIFSNGIAGAGLSIADGAYFTTGNAPFELANKNTAIQKSFNPAGATTVSDINLSAIDATATRDLVSYSFTVTLGAGLTILKISYQFGSEEYPDYVGSNFDDAVGIFVSGPGISGVQNLATTPNGSQTSINKINAGVPGFNSPTTPVAAYDVSQSAFYTNNGHVTTITGVKYNQNIAPQPGPFPIFTEHNGITKLIRRSISGLIAGGTYTIKIVIADAGDALLDSGIFLDKIDAVNTLPLNLLAFTGTKTSNGNLLEWKTASEVNTKSFEIERQQADGSGQFAVISLQVAVGYGANTYSYTDADKMSGTVFYRLKMIDNDGRFTYSNIIKLSSFNPQHSTLYPNPIKNKATLEIGDRKLLNTQANIIDVNGRTIKVFTIKTNFEIVDMSDLPAGFYMLKMANGEIQKIIKQ
jgi:Secretion system C-terminal sorting domain